MVNKGIKQKLGQPIQPGRPSGVYKNPYNVPATKFYKILRKQNREVGNAKIQQAVRQERQLVQLQRTPDAFERRSVVLSDWNGGDY